MIERASTSIDLSVLLINSSDFEIDFSEFSIAVSGGLVSGDSVVGFSHGSPGTDAYSFIEPLVFNSGELLRVGGEIEGATSGVKVGPQGILRVSANQSLIVKAIVRRSLVEAIYSTSVIAIRALQSRDSLDANQLDVKNHLASVAGDINFVATYTDPRAAASRRIQVLVYSNGPARR